MNVCIPEQASVLVDTAQTGEIMISQERDDGLPPSNVFVWPHNLPLLIAALQALLPGDAR